MNGVFLHLSSLKNPISEVLTVTPFIQIQQTRKGLPNADINNSILNGGGKKIEYLLSLIITNIG